LLLGSNAGGPPVSSAKATDSAFAQAPTPSKETSTTDVSPVPFARQKRGGDTPGDGHPAEGVAVRAGGHLAQAVEVRRSRPQRAAAPRPESSAVIAAFFAVGAAAAEARAAHIDDVRIDSAHVLKLDAEPAARPGQEVCQEYIAGSDQLMQHLQRFGLLEREADAALTAVGVLHQRREGAAADRHVHQCAEAALSVAGLGVLHLDHVRTPVREDCARGRDEGELSDLQDPHALHRSDHSRLLF
jgi:hypothetical protein